MENENETRITRKGSGLNVVTAKKPQWEWSSEERRTEIESRIVSDIKHALLMPFYDQDRERSREYQNLLLSALKMYSTEPEDIAFADNCRIKKSNTAVGLIAIEYDLNANEQATLSGLFESAEGNGHDFGFTNYDEDCNTYRISKRAWPGYISALVAKGVIECSNTDPSVSDCFTWGSKAKAIIDGA